MGGTCEAENPEEQLNLNDETCEVGSFGEDQLEAVPMDASADSQSQSETALEPG